MTPTQPVPSTRQPGPGITVSLIVGAVGILIGIVAVVAIIVPFADVFRSDVYPTPGELHLHLKHERYTVYERDGFAFGASNLTPQSLTVTAADRSTVPVEYDARDESIDRNGNSYHSALTFEPPASGDYVLEFRNSVPTTVIVARSIHDVVRGVLVWFGVGALGGALLIAGIVMLIVGITRRGRARRAAAYAAWGPPGGWYPGQPPPQWTPPGGAPGYPPSGYGPPPGYGQPGYGQPGYGQPGYPPPSYPPPTSPPPPASPPPSAPPGEPPPPAAPPDQPNP